MPKRILSILVSLCIAWTLKAGKNDTNFSPRAAREDHCASRVRHLYYNGRIRTIVCLKSGMTLVETQSLPPEHLVLMKLFGADEWLAQAASYEVDFVCEPGYSAIHRLATRDDSCFRRPRVLSPRK